MLSLSFLLWTGWSSYLENQENKIPGAVEADKRHSAAGSFGLQGSVPQIQISVRSVSQIVCVVGVLGVSVTRITSVFIFTLIMVLCD